MSEEVTVSVPRDALERAIAWADHAYHHCDVCPEDCRVDRHAGPAGRCGLDASARIYKEYLHFGEERRLVPSHTIYMSGCSFRCAFCSDWDPVSEPLAHGGVVAPEVVARRIALRRTQGAKNVNFVGGVPDVNVLAILRILAHVPADTHVVWNTNLWSSVALIEHLTPLVGTWLADFKFGNDACALKLAHVRDHDAILKDRLLRLPVDRLLIRHLLMPGHIDCCTVPVLRWLAEHRPDAPVNLMTGYHPFRLARAERSPLSGMLPPSERERALALFAELPFSDRMIDGVDTPTGLKPARNAVPEAGVRAASQVGTSENA